jgi:hypothetical protein
MGSLARHTDVKVPSGEEWEKARRDAWDEAVSNEGNNGSSLL